VLEGLSRWPVTDRRLGAIVVRLSVWAFMQQLEDGSLLKQKERVLIVDDDASSRLMLALLLRRAGHLVVGQADNGAEGLRLAGLCLPTLMLLDIDMPSVEGLTVLNKVRRLYPGVSVLAVSGLDPAIYALRCMRLGAHGFLNKSDCIALLLSAISRLRCGSTLYPQQEVKPVALWADLSDRELVMMRCLARGGDLGSIAAALCLPRRSAKELCARLQARLEMPSIEALVQFGRHMRLG
jgi:two-component system response regulator EvgA